MSIDRIGKDGMTQHERDWYAELGKGKTSLVEIAEAFHAALDAFHHVAWDHDTHGPHTLLSHDDGRWAGCRAGECVRLYRNEAE